MIEKLIQTIRDHWKGTPLQELSDEQVRQILKVITPEAWERVLGRPDFGLCVATGAEITWHTLADTPTYTPEQEKEKERRIAALEIEDMAERIAMVLKGEAIFTPC